MKLSIAFLSATSASKGHKNCHLIGRFVWSSTNMKMVRDVYFLESGTETCITVDVEQVFFEQV